MRFHPVSSIKHQASAPIGLALFVLLLLATLLCPSTSFGQGTVYHLGPRDVITLTIYAGGEQQTRVDLTVSAHGTVNAPFVGVTKVEGHTSEEVEEMITKPLARNYFVDPKVNIRVKEYHSLHYYISGAVKQPGLYETMTEASFLELIAKAGGVQPGRANFAYVMRSHSENSDENSEPVKIDLRRLLDQGDMSANILLKPGDVVHIPFQESFDLAQSKIYVEGEVKKPGIYDYQPGITVMNACIMAGGFDKFAAPNRTRIIRRKGEEAEIIKINLNDVKKGETADIELEPGDRIHVPETWL
jgi:polysaccharide export outer membrane protein